MHVFIERGPDAAVKFVAQLYQQMQKLVVESQKQWVVVPK